MCSPSCRSNVEPIHPRSDIANTTHVHLYQYRPTAEFSHSLSSPAHLAVEPIGTDDLPAGETGNRPKALVQQIYRQTRHTVSIDEQAPFDWQYKRRRANRTFFDPGIQPQRAPTVARERRQRYFRVIGHCNILGFLPDIAPAAVVDAGLAVYIEDAIALAEYSVMRTSRCRHHRRIIVVDKDLPRRRTTSRTGGCHWTT